MSLLLTSERAYVDLMLAIDCMDFVAKQRRNKRQREMLQLKDKDPEEYERRRRMKIKEKPDWNMNIIVRSWDSRIKGSLEFRTFVCNDRLTAISQYNHYCFFPELSAMQTALHSAITTKFRKDVQPVLSKAGYKNYIIDFGVVQVQEGAEGREKQNGGESDAKTKQTKRESVEEAGEAMVNVQDGGGVSPRLECVVIELNPFETSTGAGLFSWTDDRKLLHGCCCCCCCCFR